MKDIANEDYNGEQQPRPILVHAAVQRAFLMVILPYRIPRTTGISLCSFPCSAKRSEITD